MHIAHCEVAVSRGFIMFTERNILPWSSTRLSTKAIVVYFNTAWVTIVLVGVGGMVGLAHTPTSQTEWNDRVSSPYRSRVECSSPPGFAGTAACLADQ